MSGLIPRLSGTDHIFVYWEFNSMRNVAFTRSRVCVIVLLLCAFFAQSSAFESEHQQHNSSQHCCLLCHIGPLPFVQAGAIATAEPLVAIAWLPPSDPRHRKHDVLPSSDSSRAPPAPTAFSL